MTFKNEEIRKALQWGWSDEGFDRWWESHEARKFEQDGFMSPARTALCERSVETLDVDELEKVIEHVTAGGSLSNTEGIRLLQTLLVERYPSFWRHADIRKGSAVSLPRGAWDVDHYFEVIEVRFNGTLFCQHLCCGGFETLEWLDRITKINPGALPVFTESASV